MIVIVAGMPRSASTLQSNIANELVSVINCGERVDWNNSWQDDHQELISRIKSERIYIYKAHFIKSGVLKIAAQYPESVKFLVSYRDPRDVTVSMMSKFDYSFNKAITRIGKSIDNIYNIRRNECNCLEQKYCQLRYELKKCILEVSEYLEVKVDEEQLNVIYDLLNVDSAYAKAKSNESIIIEKFKRYFTYLTGKSIVHKDKRLMLHPNHISKTKGKEGLWKSNLSSEQVKIIEDKFSSWLD